MSDHRFLSPAQILSDAKGSTMREEEVKRKKEFERKTDVFFEERDVEIYHAIKLLKALGPVFHRRERIT